MAERRPNIEHRTSTFAHFVLSFLEALLKCLPVFVIQLLAVYPLLAVGQGREALNALLDPAPANISWFLFPLSLAYSCILTGSFLFFLLGRWNFPAENHARAFCRIWVPAVLTLSVGLLWPVAVEIGSKQSTLWDAIGGFTILGITIAMICFVWKLTKPIPSRNVIIFIAAAVTVLFGLWTFAPLLVFYGASFVAITVFCAFIAKDFRDSETETRQWQEAHRAGLGFAVLFVIGVFLLSRTSVPWRMFMGTPCIIVSGFSFQVALAFLVTALLSLVSPVLVRFAWMMMAVIVFLSPLNHEPVRTLAPDPGLPSHQPPSKHFIEWLRNREELKSSAAPYPVFFVAAQGGGVRAAYWTSTLLAGMEERYPGFTNHIYAISGVSGGSLGGALFTAFYCERYEHGERKCAPLAPGGIQGFRPCVSYIFQWDLLGPPLSGFLFNDLPFGWIDVRRAADLERGLEYAWYGSTETRRFEEPFRDLWRVRPYHVPSLILNATSADNGRPIVVSNLSAKGELTEDPGVEEFLGRPIRLSTAAFLSARFPVISPVAIVKSPGQDVFRLVDGGYFNNSGMASIAQLLRVILPAASRSEFAGRIQPVVLVISSSPATFKPSQRRFAGSLAGALLEPVKVLENTGDAHEATYLDEVADLMGANQVYTDLRPPKGSVAVPLGWVLSAETRCKMDQMVNTVLNESEGSTAIGLALGKSASQPATWSSCRPVEKVGR